MGKLAQNAGYSWQQAAGRWIEETTHKATHHQDIAKLKWLHSILGELMLDEITLDVVGHIKEARLKVAGKTTANRFLALVRAILKRAVDEWDWLDKAPKIRLFKESGGRIRFITPEQVQALLGELPRHQRDMVLFALQTGLRQSNVVKLEWLQVNLEQGHMWVNAAQSKNRKPISVPLNREALAVLHRQLGKHPARVFTFAGQPIANANTRAWRNALKRAGIEDFRWHDLRHTWASWHRMRGTPTHELQQLGGWKTGAMVDTVAAVELDDRTHDTEDGKRRDANKNKWLQKAGIPLVRLRDPEEARNIQVLLRAAQHEARSQNYQPTPRHDARKKPGKDIFITLVVILAAAWISIWTISAIVQNLFKTGTNAVAAQQEVQLKAEQKNQLQMAVENLQKRQEAERAKTQREAEQAEARQRAEAQQPRYERVLVRGKSLRECSSDNIITNESIRCMRDHYEMVQVSGAQ